jgi:hypothetical protein
MESLLRGLMKLKPQNPKTPEMKMRNLFILNLQMCLNLGDEKPY